MQLKPLKNVACVKSAVLGQEIWRPPVSGAGKKLKQPVVADTPVKKVEFCTVLYLVD